MKENELKNALDNALSALHILANTECDDNLTKSVVKNCEDRKKRFKEAFEFLKEFKAKL